MNYCEFGLLVTGVTEEAALPNLFRSISASGLCHFKVVRKINQLSPKLSEKHAIKMTGTTKTVPNRDTDMISLPARTYLSLEGRCLLLIDDIEKARDADIAEVYQRYVVALHQLLTDEQKRRSGVFFLANMVEAYYFGDPHLTSKVLSLTTPLPEPTSDVEKIPHPKGVLKRMCDNFNEVEHGSEILKNINISKVLSRNDSCAWLRSLCKWCLNILMDIPGFDVEMLDEPLQCKAGVVIPWIVEQRQP